MEQSDLRKRVLRFIRSSLNVKRDSNIIFVCGGNGENHLCVRFRKEFKDFLDEYVYFTPESALENINNGELEQPFDLADFEELISEISHSIVVFPEAPGSFSETGYFSAIEKIAKKVILVLDVKYQKEDSLISLGPANKIEKYSNFRPVIQFDYINPDFAVISARIKKRKTYHNKKQLIVDRYASLSKYEKACIIQFIISLLHIATVEDVIFVMRGLFDSRISETEVKLLIGILAGAQCIEKIGNYGHYRRPRRMEELLEVRDGAKNEFSSIRIELTGIYQQAPIEFLSLIGAA